MQAPICPPQSTPPFESGPFDWVKRLIFGRTWFLFFENIARALVAILKLPLYLDCAWFMPGTIVAATQPVFRYPCPPQVRVSPYVIYSTLNTAPVGSSATISVWRSGLSSTPGGKIADITFTAGSNNGLATYYDAENFSVPDAEFFIVVNTVGSGTAGADLFVIMRA